MENYALKLQQQVKELDKLILEADRRIRTNPAPKNLKIWVTNRKNGYQYYEMDGQGKRRYIPKEKELMVRNAVQREYDQTVRRVLADMRHRIVRFLRTYDTASVENVYHKLCEARKTLVDPIIPTDKSFIEEWKKAHCGQQNEYPMTASYLTEQGEMVRSKSEKILADIFLKHHIPYTYEPRIVLKGKAFYPDFALLNLRTRKTIYWEHFGRISEGEYATKAFSKLRMYDDCGLEVGKDFLFSSESESQPLDQKKIEEKIGEYLL